MAITAVDKVKINKYLKEHSIGDIYYLDMCDALGKRGKISDIEFLEYFTNVVTNELRKNEKISSNYLTKIVSIVDSFLGWVHEDGSKAADDTLDKIRSFKDFYDDYLERTGFERDSILSDDYIESVVKKVNELYPSDVNNESVSKYINRVAELEGQVKKLERDLTEVTQLYDSLQENYDQKSDKVRELRDEIVSLEKDVRVKNKEVIGLNETIESLTERIRELEVSLTEIQDENALLTPYRAQYEGLLEEVTRLKKVIEDDIAVRTAEANLRIRQTSIEELMYQKLLFDKVSVDDLLRYVKAQGFTSDNNEIAGLLRRMKSKINIETSSFSLSPSYKIVTPTVLEDGSFSINVPFGCKHYDVMLVSDFHLKDFDSKTLLGFDILNDYCARAGINLVLNLGDFYDGFGSNPLDYENAVKNYKVAEQAISMIPKGSGLYHAILGGNHDKNVSKYGFDPIAMLAQEREDFINLGYTHSTISIDSPTGVLGKFDIHHPDTFDFPIKLNEDGIDIGEMNTYLHDIYSKQGRSRDESYIDIFGHTHRSQFNYPGAYCYVPSYFEGRSKKGACHLRIYFDEDTDIKYMVFMPLSYGTGNNLVKNNEIVYQKVLSR